MTTLRLLLILFLVLNALAFAAIQGWLGGGVPTGEPERIANQLNPEHIRLAHEARPSADEADARPLELAETAPEAPPALAMTPAATPTADLVVEPEAAPAQAAEDEGDAHALVIDAEDAINRDSPAVDPAPVAEAPVPVAPLPPEPVAPAEPTAPAPATICQAWAGLTAAEADRLGQGLRRIGVTAVRSRNETPDSWWVRIPPQPSRAEADTRVAELRLLGVSDTFIVQERGPTQYAVSLGVFKTENRARVLLSQLRARGVSNAGVEPRMTTSYRMQATLPAAQLRSVEQGIARVASKRQSCAAR
ncbi:SPOR domain-containing protein [Thauera sp.]|uniref:SPOR domain-containing protein n=1 Tax=Thauera sp. TaxID=1905334 RepID=UPI002C102BE5|nr:SPOR domain-containing protein [Thauera sp.]HRP25216.1 SPOR domain-containing protein [Thauera sp.]